MRNIVFCILAVAALLLAPKGFSQHAERKVLFRLNQHEQLYYAEYYAETSFAGAGFSAILADTLSGSKTFVFKGQRIATTFVPFDVVNKITGETDFNQRYFRMPFLDAGIQNGYAFSFRNAAGDVNVNLGGKSYGPYADASIHHYVPNSGFGFIYITQGKYWINMNDKVYGPFSKAGFINDSTFAYEAGRLWYECSATGAITGPFAGGSPQLLGKQGWGATCPGNYITVFRKGRNRFKLNHNGQIHALKKNIEYVDNMAITESGCFCLRYTGKKQKSYILINHSKFGPYYKYNCSGPSINSKGDWAFSFTNDKNQMYIMSNSGVSGPFISADYDMHMVLMSENGKLAFTANGFLYFGDSSWPVYDGLTNIVIHNNMLAFSYKKDDKHYVNTGGNEISGPYEYGIDGFQLFEDASYKYAFPIGFNEWGINDNGNLKGPFAALELLQPDKMQDSPYKFLRYEGYSSYILSEAGTVEPFDRFLHYSLSDGRMQVVSPDGKHCLTSSPENEYVTIDGLKYGNSAPLRAWFDGSDNSFYWNALENAELVIYSLKIEN